MLFKIGIIQKKQNYEKKAARKIVSNLIEANYATDPYVSGNSFLMKYRICPISFRPFSVI